MDRRCSHHNVRGRVDRNESRSWVLSWEYATVPQAGAGHRHRIGRDARFLWSVDSEVASGSPGPLLQSSSWEGRYDSYSICDGRTTVERRDWLKRNPGIQAGHSAAGDLDDWVRTQPVRQGSDSHPCLSSAGGGPLTALSGSVVVSRSYSGVG